MMAPGSARSAYVRRKIIAEYPGTSTYCIADINNALLLPPPAAPPNKPSREYVRRNTFWVRDGSSGQYGGIFGSR